MRDLIGEPVAAADLLYGQAENVEHTSLRTRQKCWRWYHLDSFWDEYTR